MSITNLWTLGLAAAGLISLPAAGLADEQPSPLLTALTPTTLSGYVNTSVEWNPGTGNARVPGFVYAAGKQDGFNLNVVSLEVEKALDESEWAAGYAVQLWFGPDANTFASGSSLNQAAGPVNPVSLANNADFAIKQAFVALRAPVGNGLDFKVGVFDGLLGYESHDAYKNPNYTRAYGMAFTPHTHTGVQMAYQFTPLVGGMFAVGNTVGPTINQRANGPKAESFKSYSGLLVVTAPDGWGFLSGSTLYGGALNGFSNGDNWDQTSFYVGTTLNTPVNSIKAGASFSYLGTTGEFSGGHNYGNAWALYGSFEATEKLSLHLRGEYATTDTALFGDDPAAIGATGGSKVLAATATLQYNLWANVVSRLEFRWDHQAGDGDMSGFGGDPRDSDGSPAAPGQGQRDFVTIALNLIYRF